jgi:hypothetical protein
MKRRSRSLLALVLVFVLVTLLFSPLFLAKAQAGTLTSSKVTITDSRAGITGVSDTFAFTTAVTGIIGVVEFLYCTTASGACTTPAGLVTTSGVQGTVTGLSASTSVFTTNGTITLTVTTPASIPSATAITAQYTTLTNPTGADTTYFVRITTKTAALATIDGPTTVAFAVLTSTSIAVTASVDPTLTFTVAAVTSGGSVNGATTNITTTANTIPFATLVDGTAKIGAHDLTVTTNATVGYQVTVKALADPPLSDAANNIDKWTGTNAAPTAWSAPAGTANSVNTGLFGYTTNDATLESAAVDRFTTAGGNKWAGVNSTAEQAAYSAVGVLSQITRVGWEAEINEFQAPGSYSGTVILVATPTY